MSQHICFYSARCRYSQAFLEELSHSPYAKEFRFVCVDASAAGVRPTLPPYVKAVPTLMIKGEHEPRTDGNVMNWLSERRLQERQGVAGASVAGSGSGSASASAEGPMAFSQMDFMMGDEGYSFIGEDTTATKGTVVRMAGNMASINDLSTMVVPDSRIGSAFGSSMPGPASGPSSAPGSEPMSAKAKAFQDSFDRFRAGRDKDIPGPPGRK